MDVRRPVRLIGDHSHKLLTARNKSLERQVRRLQETVSRLRSDLKELRGDFLVNQSEWACGRVAEVPVVLEEFRARLEEFTEFRRTSGVYFLLLANDVVYVGQTTDLAGRVRTHLDDKLFDRVMFIRADESDLDRIETAFIRHLAPKHNRSQGRVMPDIYEVLREFGFQRVS